MFFNKYLTKNRMLNQTRYFTTVRKELNSILDFITETLESSGLDSKACSRTRFRSEDLALIDGPCLRRKQAQGDGSEDLGGYYGTDGLRRY